MDTLITIVQNDYGYDLNFTLKDSAGVVVSLINSVITFIAQSSSDDSVQFTGPMVITNTLAGMCKYTVQQNDFQVFGSWTAQISLNYGTGTEIVTFSGIKIDVVPKLPVA